MSNDSVVSQKKFFFYKICFDVTISKIDSLSLLAFSFGNDPPKATHCCYIGEMSKWTMGKTEID